MVKRGLVVTYYFPPSGGGGVQRWTKLIKYLSRQSWQFTVITAAIEKSSLIDESLLNEIPAQAKVIRPEIGSSGKISARKMAQRIRRGYIQRWVSAFVNLTDSRKSWNRQVIPVIDAELENSKYDVLFVSIPPYSLALLAAHYTAKLDIPVILDMRDPWTINPYKIYPTPWHRYLDRRSEKKIIKRIKYLSSAYQSVVDDYQHFSNPEFIVMPNGYDEEDFSGLNKTVLPDPDAFNLAFSGSFYSHLNHPGNLFKSIAILKAEGFKITFHHIGAGVLDLDRLAKVNKISEMVKLWGYQPHKKCLEILNSMDALCVILDPFSANADKTIGGKLYEYLRFKKPILAVIPDNGEAANLIQETKSGIICPDSNPQSIARCIKDVITGKYEFNFLNIEKYARSNQAKILNRFLSDLLNSDDN